MRTGGVESGESTRVACCDGTATYKVDDLTGAKTFGSVCGLDVATQQMYISVVNLRCCRCLVFLPSLRAD